jgi:hypothetical protein
MWVRDASSREKMPTIKKLNDPDFFPYRYGHAFWAYVAGRWGDSAVGDMLRATGPKRRHRRSHRRGPGHRRRDADEGLARGDAEDLRLALSRARESRDVCAGAGQREDERRQPECRAGTQPRRQAVVFLSERSRLSVDMYLADVATGKIIRQLTKTAADPHFDSLDFLSSAGDWAPDNKRSCSPR